MTTRTQGRVGRVLATMLLLLMALVLLRPARASAFGPIGAAGAALNLATGTAIANPDPPTPEELEARKVRASLVESVFGLDETAGPATLAESVERRWERVRRDLSDRG